MKSLSLRTNSLNQLILLVVFLIVLPGCTKNFVMRPVQTPITVYPAATAAEPSSFAIKDLRGSDSKPFSVGTLNVEFTGMNNELAYFGENLERVLAAEGVKVSYSAQGDADLKMNVRKYRLRNHRSSGFSAYYTFATFSADVAAGDKAYRVAAYFKMGKVPVWAFREVERPCYQIPMESMVKEVAAKLNSHTFGRVVPTEAVNKLVANIDSFKGGADESSEEYLKVLELGYSNNPAAIPPLVRLTSHNQPIMRAAALSALGMLGAKEQFPLFKKMYETEDNVVKSMALKAIGDLDTPEAKAYLQGVKQSKDYKDDIIQEIVDLYM